MPRLKLRIVTRPDGHHHLERWVEGHWSPLVMFSDLSKAIEALKAVLHEHNVDLDVEVEVSPDAVDAPKDPK